MLSKRRIEEAAQDNLWRPPRSDGQRRVAPVTDQLQANTAFAQAVYERAKAEGDLRSSLGALAVDMSLSPGRRAHLAGTWTCCSPDTHFVRAVRDLLEECA